MSRVRAEALALVNWKGVFYERYELDRHVTALEGDNGAGKTTVMVAAYVVLLPDMTRLRFTNLGETGATGGDKGIWGRLGELGRPSYAALDFRLPNGERVLAGVHLDRKGEPTVEPTPFVVTGLGDDVRLQDLLLLAQGEIEQVPELGELRDNAARLGGRLQVFGSAREYFVTLFEHGITPMRLGTDEERNKLNEMLKTSMTGGMSKGLLQELRSFLLKEEGGLAETLQRMRANLDACRRTRTEVLEAQRLEREIGSVYEAGEEMFAAAIAATRQRAEEMSRRVTEKEELRRRAEVRAAEAVAALEATREALQKASEQREAATIEAQQAEAWERRVGEALHWARERDARKGAFEEAARRCDDARLAKDQAEQDLQQATTALREATDGRERAAAGLADLQKGLEELHRRAAAHRRAVGQLVEARRLLETPALDPDDAEQLQPHFRGSQSEVDRERRELSRRLDDANSHRAEHAQGIKALGLLLESEVDPVGVVDVARDALSTVRSWREAAARRKTLGTEIRSVAAEAERQAQARVCAHRLLVTWESGGGRAAVLSGLSESESELAALHEQARAADALAADAMRLQEACRVEIVALDARGVAYRDLAGRAARVAEALGEPVDGRSQLGAARATLLERVGAQRVQLTEVTAKREALIGEARELLHAGGSFPAELLKLRDDLTAELLAAQFDDADVPEAAELEARLGPLAQALVVTDVEAATLRLGSRAATLSTVWLVAEDAALSLDPDRVVGRAAERDVVVDDREARRVTRIPDRPTLGRAARERRAADLERMARDMEQLIEAARQSERATRTVLADADVLLEGAAVWVLGDPTAELITVRARAAEAGAAVQGGRLDADRARTDANALRPRLDGLRDLLPDAALLDAPDKQTRVDELREALSAAEGAAAQLTRVGDAPSVLERRLDALRSIPLSEAEIADAQSRLAALDRRRDALAGGLEALDYVATNREALRWTDAASRLEEQRDLVPALQDQLDTAKEAQERAQATEAATRRNRDTATGGFHEADAKYTTARERLGEAVGRVAEIGIEDPSESTLADAHEQTATTRARREGVEAEVGSLQQEIGRAESAAETASQEAERSRTAEEEEHKQARPAIDAWERLRPQVESAGLLSAALSDRFQAVFGEQASVNVWQRAGESRARLLERLRTAQGGPTVLIEIQRWLEATDQTTGEGYLRAWMTVRDWLRSRLPAQIAEVDEPLLALDRFRDHLSGLVERLDGQERDLRGTSEDVARGIDVQIRKAQGRVRRLNGHLEGVRFGSIRGIRVRMQRVERMEQVLRALRSGEAQGLLFQPDLPVEDALAEIFKRFGGGRTGGQKLLDYREYIHLHVEVLRQDSSDWEVANPTRLSTGEAIGVGAALMMVVLTEWERDANLLRGRKSFGSMRFLFLDEANRLDKANLGTVFDLCRSLELQLLVAAPEVSRAEGCTVFRLVRTRLENGREEVLVSGRRVVADEPEL